MALSFEGMQEAYDMIVEISRDFSFDFVNYKVKAFDTPRKIYPAIRYYLESGKTLADSKYFSALEGQFYS